MAVQLGAVLQTVTIPVEELIANLPASVPVIDHVPANEGDAGVIVAVAVKTTAFAELGPAAKLPVGGETPEID